MTSSTALLTDRFELTLLGTALRDDGVALAEAGPDHPHGLHRREVRAGIRDAGR
ncbi:hypothetical protein ACWDR7_11715 [Microbacterium sp. NPDC003461]